MRRNEPEKRARALDDYDGRSRTPPVIRWKRAAPMRFRATDRTLSEKELNQAFDSVVEKVTGETAYELRR